MSRSLLDRAGYFDERFKGAWLAGTPCNQRPVEGGRARAGLPDVKGVAPAAEFLDQPPGSLAEPALVMAVDQGVRINGYLQERLASISLRRQKCGPGQVYAPGSVQDTEPGAMSLFFTSKT